MSHPLRVRELKRWIRKAVVYGQRRTLYGCVNWNIGGSDAGAFNPGRTLYGCVNWNAVMSYEEVFERASHPLLLGELNQLFICLYL